MTDREKFEKWFVNARLKSIPFEENMFQAWQARGELDAERIKELEADLDDRTREVNLRCGQIQERDIRIADLKDKNKVAEESELLALRNNDGLRVQIAELTAKLDKAKEALKCIDEDLVNPVHYILVKEALEELDK